MDDIVVANGHRVPSLGEGTITIQKAIIHNVLLVPRLRINALSVSELIAHGCKVLFFEGGSVVKF